MSQIHVPAPALNRYIEQVWAAIGADERECRLLAEHLVGANLAGHDSHGVGMLVEYVPAAKAGALRVGAKAELVKDAGAVVSLDGQRGLGQVMAYEAMELGIERAGAHGVAVVALRNTHHVGRIGHWAEQCAAAGFASVHFVSVPGDVLVAPLGCRDARFGTNPFCAAFPRPGQTPILLDFATSKIALGKARVAYNSGVPVPPGCVIDADGVPSTDPGVMWNEPMGSLLPFGDHKGYGLALMCELFAGALGGAPTTTQETLTQPPGIYNAMLSFVLDPSAFEAPDSQRSAQAFLDWVGASPAGDDPRSGILPGEPEQTRRQERLRDGIPIDATTWADVRSAALDAGLAASDVPDVQE
ncbi:malate/lactate/ureidoglycolate dehydrogenase [Gephyromycinifex aptenodytis]|uniref:malate/lactate/ureidoglycolate dehydrogenase n=1 Tax=Gephyromycinifex aptenodytis TaxID=2716227 RepID=UPI00144810FB|nr:malate/lactate/ureidoglycolate dehydrogenase [Gephyromycinifex aptenodytis]